MSLANVIAAVTARVAAVPSARNVYSYARDVKEGAQFIAQFSDPATKTIHTWMVTRQGTQKIDEGIQQCRHIHEIVMMGYHTVSDANGSEAAFQQVIEDVCAAFDPFPLRQYGGEFDWSQPVQVEGPTVLMYGRFLCHAVKLIHKVEEVLP